jgi:inositol-pentakisphosphate 2-kinase
MISGQDPNNGYEADDASIMFQQKVISRLLPASHLPRLKSVKVEKSWLEQLSAAHNNIRPVGRRETDHIDVTRKKAVLATDLVGGDWIAVEIKVRIKTMDCSSR